MKGITGGAEAKHRPERGLGTATEREQRGPFAQREPVAAHPEWSRRFAGRAQALEARRDERRHRVVTSGNDQIGGTDGQPGQGLADGEGRRCTGREQLRAEFGAGAEARQQRVDGAEVGAASREFEVNGPPRIKARQGVLEAAHAATGRAQRHGQPARAEVRHPQLQLADELFAGAGEERGSSVGAGHNDDLGSRGERLAQAGGLELGVAAHPARREGSDPARVHRGLPQSEGRDCAVGYDHGAHGFVACTSIANAYV